MDGSSCCDIRAIRLEGILKSSSKYNFFEFVRGGKRKQEAHIDYLNVDEKWYLENRVLDQIDWYSSNSAKNKRLYFSLVVIDIILSAMIPFAVLFMDIFKNVNYIIAAMGSIVTIVSGVVSTFQFQKKWIEYRTTAETLKHTNYLYVTKTNPYSREDAFSYFVQNVESLISTQNTNWAFYIQKNIEEQKVTDDE